MEHRQFDIRQKNQYLQIFAGVEDKNIKMIESLHQVDIFYNTEMIDIKGKQVNDAYRLVKTLFEVIDRYKTLDTFDIPKINDAVLQNKENLFLDALGQVVARTYNGKPIRPKTLGQKFFIDDMLNHDLTFAIGPAGTGKTFLAICVAVELLKKGDIKKIILTRPAVEAGENLGFLPGDLKEKVDPYLRPLYDALDEMLSSERTERFIEKGVIEIAPLAYMRGRTLDDAVVILDEAQNATTSQMLMFLTRLGRNSKMIVTGDLTQTDLLKKQESGLKVSIDRLSLIKGISFVQLNNSDVVRHPLVIQILKAFEGE